MNMKKQIEYADKALGHIKSAIVLLKKTEEMKGFADSLESIEKSLLFRVIREEERL